MLQDSNLRKGFFLSLALLVVWALSGIVVGWSWAMGRSSIALGIAVAMFVLLGAVSYAMVYQPLRVLDQCRHRLDRMNITDDLTGLLNRTSILMRLEAELNRAWRSGEPLSCALVNIDGFRKINEQFGLEAGDSVLRTVGNLIAESCRQYDAAGRYGGEEFLLVLPSAELDNAARAAERLRRRIETSEFACHGQGFHVTVSIGVAQADLNVLETPDALTGRANEARERARREGANRVSAVATLAFVEHAAAPTSTPTSR